MRAHILSIAAVAIGSQLASGSLAAQRGIAPLATRPNVVLVIMDDIGYGDLGSYGVSDAKTPNLDRLAREGVRLTDGYANGPVCSPTRAALISGRYQQRVGIEWALSSVNDKDKSLPVTRLAEGKDCRLGEGRGSQDTQSVALPPSPRDSIPRSRAGPRLRKPRTGSRAESRRA